MPVPGWWGGRRGRVFIDKAGNPCRTPRQGKRIGLVTATHMQRNETSGGIAVHHRLLEGCRTVRT